MLDAARVEQVLDQRIRPALMMDGGNIELVEVRDNTIYVRLTGACGGCPSATITLRHGVERVLREEFPEMAELTTV